MHFSVTAAYRYVSGIAVFLSDLNFFFLLILQWSRDPALHTPFYRIFKVNVLYAISNMLSRTNFYFCFGSALEVVVVDCWSKWRLAVLFAMQFAIPVGITAAFPDLEYSENDRGCFMYLEHDATVSILRSIIHSCFVFPSLLFMKLTVGKSKELREKKNLSRSARRQQENLVKYTIYCAIIQNIQCTVIFIRMIIIEERIPEAYHYTPLFIYIINLGYENIPTLMLIYLSNSVRRRLARFISCSVNTVQTTEHPTASSLNEAFARKYTPS
ncbi:hypothetical protein PENTCL1PPCAC_3777, partial [Pristionchus entomophagus]